MKSVNFAVQLLKSDDCVTLMARGEVSKAELINEAIRQGEIDGDDRERFEKAEFCTHKWMKAVPRERYSTYYCESREGVRGAFKATCLQYLW
ncbi:hypothetical protein GEO10_03720 [Escherichia coli]|uniref:hypothetical protein n=1 Tax=Escherichia coli TaxID=562 RepID=UPI000BB6F545|nr:hypothetical protein [Escherichia coli]EFH9192655.1 hypothetical protein [Escherichia coli]EFN9979263.1 hypothetical protein [Escherichia coli]ELI7332898.1 hypothetical protein [Escherichia coli]MDA5353239.1 hypothetical protein [Escherichia coli]HAP1435358.1 hypothetical protein [Escherichia coli]